MGEGGWQEIGLEKERAPSPGGLARTRLSSDFPLRAKARPGDPVPGNNPVSAFRYW